ncbi:MAG: hypothetical protein LAO03_21990, partial [Acidobacteriia bacterium]|nr:hypothetical protein [Terriglobia bacterium]
MMKTTILTLGTISWDRRLLSATAVFGLLLLFGFTQTGLAQTATSTPLSLSNNYIVTGDYVVGGWVGQPTQNLNGYTPGTINIPDTVQTKATGVTSPGVPAGADIVAAFLYWTTVESSGTFAGQQAYFRGYPISGVPLGNLNAPVSWSSGGCAGSSQGSKTMQVYRADVSAYLPVDSNGNSQPNASYPVRLADNGKSGNTPFTLGASLVLVYRVLSPAVPLNAIVIYDGPFAPSNSSQIMTQLMQGFYQAGFDQTGSTTPVAKITHIVGNGQSNKNEQVYFINNQRSSTTPLPSLYSLNGTPLPPFPGIYNGSWDNPTWILGNLVGGNPVQAGDSSETTSVVPSATNKGCVSWGAVILSTTVQDSDHDGLLDVWKTNHGYCDAGANLGMTNQGTCTVGDSSWVDLSGATSGQKDVFLQLDYMCSIVKADGTCDTTNGISYLPDPSSVLGSVTSAFLSHSINVHIDPIHHIIPEETCTDNTSVSPPQYCSFPGQAGVVGWKSGFGFLKNQPLNYPDETSCETQTPVGGTPGSGPPCVRRFQPGRRNSYHYALFGRALAVPNWSFQDGSLQGIAVPAPGVVTFTTSSPHGLAVDAYAPNGRVTVSDAISNPNLNGTYLVQSVPTTTSFTIQVANATTAPTPITDPNLSLASGVVGTGSGFSDLGGADSLITLGLWGADGQTAPVESGTLMHELGHSLGLTHGGSYPVAGSYALTLEPNCKPNFQSVMNYLFQVDLLDGALDYSNQELPATPQSLDESASSPSGVLGSALHPTTKWYAPNQAFGSPATRHCDGTPLLSTDQPMFRLEGPASSITWSNQD